MTLFDKVKQKIYLNLMLKTLADNKPFKIEAIRRDEIVVWPLEGKQNLITVKRQHFDKVEMHGDKAADLDSSVRTVSYIRAMLKYAGETVAN